MLKHEGAEHHKKAAETSRARGPPSQGGGPASRRRISMKRADIMPISRMATICMLLTTLRKPRRRTPISTEKRTNENGNRGKREDSSGLGYPVDRLSVAPEIGI